MAAPEQQKQQPELTTKPTPPQVPVVQGAQVAQAHSIAHTPHQHQHHHHHHHQHHHHHHHHMHAFQMQQMMHMQQMQMMYMGHMNPMMMGNIPSPAPAPVPVPSPAPVQSSDKAEDWAEYKTPEGKIYWGHKTTKETTWTEPEPIRHKREEAERKKAAAAHIPQGEAEAGWVEYKDETGRSYYHNKGRNKTVYSLPPEVRSLRKQKEQAKLKAMMGSSNNNTNTPPPSVEKDRQPSPEPEPIMPPRMSTGSMASLAGQEVQEERIYGNKKERVEAFRNMLVDLKVDPEAAWEDVLKTLIADERYSALKSKKDKVNSFKEYCEKTLRERKDAEKRQKRHAYEAFQAMLSGAELSSPISYDSGAQLYGDTEAWKGMENAGERRRAFNEFMAKLDERTKEKRRKTQITMAKGLGELLQEADVRLPDARQLTISQCLTSTQKKDPRYAGASEDCRTFAYQEYIVHLENLEEIQKERAAHEARKTEKPHWEEFLKLLSDSVANGALHCFTKWKDFSHCIRAEPIYAKLQGSSARHDLFDMKIDELTISFEKDRKRLTRAVLKKKLKNILDARTDSFSDLTPPVHISSIEAFLHQCRSRVQDREDLLSHKISRLKSHIASRSDALSTPKHDLLSLLQREPMWDDLADLDPTSTHRLSAIDEAITELQDNDTRKRKRDKTDGSTATRKRDSKASRRDSRHDKERKRRRRRSST